MPNKTLIEWTDYTSNGISARRKGISYAHFKSGWFCDKPDKDGGCLRCYAESLNLRWGNGLRFDKANRNQIDFLVRIQEQIDLQKLNIKSPGSKVFVGDMFDLFQPSIPVEVLSELFNAYDVCTNLTLQFLTKYPARMSNFFFERYGGGVVPKHFWLGISAASQEWFNKTFTHLTHIGGTRFLSLEPLLSPITIKNYLHLIDWVIVGGESGTGARPCNLQWIRSIIDQCKTANVPVFVKQLGSGRLEYGKVHIQPVGNGDKQAGSWTFKNSKGGDISEWPEDLQVREFPNV